MSKMKDQAYFSRDWLTDPDFRNWLGDTNDNTAVHCKVCHQTSKLSNMGRWALTSHISGKSHKKLFDRKQFFFKPKNSEQSKACSSSSQNNTPIEIEKDNEPTVVNQPSIELMLKDSQMQKAEAVWVLKSVLSGYSNNSCADIGKMFTCMFPDIKIAKSFELGATKLKYVINFRIVPYFRDILYNHVQKSDCFVISFDESLNNYTQNSQMDISIRYFDHVEDRMKVCYLDSKFLDMLHIKI